jgi:phosphate-selective porin OprO/OprP
MTARLTGLPWFENGGEKLLHLGVAYSIRGTNDDHSVRYRTRPEAHWVQYRFLDTGALVNVDHVQLLGAEAAAVYGPFSLQSELVSSLLDFDSRTASAGSSRDNVCFNSFYVQASYFLTPGDRRNYSTGSGAFAAVKPKRSFRQDGGWGAVELATRLSYLDLDEERLGGAGRGELRDWTIGVNWYLHPNVRVMANYILSMPNRIDTQEDASIFMMRFQVDF